MISYLSLIKLVISSLDVTNGMLLFLFGWMLMVHKATLLAQTETISCWKDQFTTPKHIQMQAYKHPNEGSNSDFSSPVLITIFLISLFLFLLTSFLFFLINFHHQNRTTTTYFPHIYSTWTSSNSKWKETYKNQKIDMKLNKT